MGAGHQAAGGLPEVKMADFYQSTNVYTSWETLSGHKEPAPGSWDACAEQLTLDNNMSLMQGSFCTCSGKIKISIDSVVRSTFRNQYKTVQTLKTQGIYQFPIFIMSIGFIILEELSCQDQTLSKDYQLRRVPSL
jgi:hypothetical protein